jgi:hypothetical protein
LKADIRAKGEGQPSSTLFAIRDKDLPAGLQNDPAIWSSEQTTCIICTFKNAAPWNFCCNKVNKTRR